LAFELGARLGVILSDEALLWKVDSAP
jgi:hypothetical protein